jgi:hypothetical protein
VSFLKAHSDRRTGIKTACGKCWPLWDMFDILGCLCHITQESNILLQWPAVAANTHFSTFRGMYVRWHLLDYLLVHPDSLLTFVLLVNEKVSLICVLFSICWIVKIWM